MIVIVTPCVDSLARFSQGEERMLVKAFVAQSTVEQFDEGVLHGPAGLDVMPVETTGGPTQHRTTGQLGAVITDYHLWHGALDCDCLVPAASQRIWQRPENW